MDPWRSWYAAPEIQEWAQALLVVMSLAGLLLNVLVVYVVGRRRAALTTDVIFMALVGSFDIVACSFALVTSLLRMSGAISHHDPDYCRFDLFLFSTTTFASLIMTSTLSAARYLVVVRNWNLTTRTCLVSTAAFLCLLWIETLGRGLSNPLIVMPSGLYCMPYTRDARGAKLVFEVMYCLLMVPCPVVILASYGLVTRHFHRHIKRTALSSANQLDREMAQPRILVKYMRKKYLRTHLSHLVKLMLVAAIYFVALLPEYTMSIATLLLGAKRTPAIDSVAFLAIFSLSLINPLFVLHINDNHLPRSLD